METKNMFSEVRCDYFNTEEGWWTIDAWVTGEDDEEGRVVGWVDGMSGNIYYKDDKVASDPLVNEIAKARQEAVRKDYHQKQGELGETMVMFAWETFQKAYDMMPEKDFTECACMVRNAAMHFEKEVDWQGVDDKRDYVTILEKYEENWLRNLRKLYCVSTEEDVRLEELHQSMEYKDMMNLMYVMEGECLNYSVVGMFPSTQLSVNGYDHDLCVVDVSLHCDTKELQVFCDVDGNGKHVTLYEKDLRPEHLAMIKKDIMDLYVAQKFIVFVDRFGKKLPYYETKVIESILYQNIATLILDGKKECSLYRIIPHDNTNIEFDFADTEGNDVVKTLADLSADDIKTITSALNVRYLIEFFNL